MPTYEYACRECGEHLEVVQSFRDDALTDCFACDRAGTLRKVFSAAGIIFKGSGWHIKDYSAANNAGTDSSGGDTGSSSGDTGSGKGDAGKTDAGKTDGGRTGSGKTGGKTGGAESGSGTSGSATSGSGRSGTSSSGTGRSEAKSA